MPKEQITQETNTTETAVAAQSAIGQEDNPQIKKGSIIQIRKDAAECNGVKTLSCAYLRNSTVKDLKGNKADITYGGLPLGKFLLKDLDLVK